MMFSGRFPPVAIHRRRLTLRLTAGARPSTRGSLPKKEKPETLPTPERFSMPAGHSLGATSFPRFIPSMPNIKTRSEKNGKKFSVNFDRKLRSANYAVCGFSRISKCAGKSRRAGQNQERSGSEIWQQVKRTGTVISLSEGDSFLPLKKG